jgi:hypothetical protein
VKKLSGTDRGEILAALGHIRNALIADTAGGYPGPPLEAAELCLLRVLFSDEEEIEEYLKLNGRL